MIDLQKSPTPMTQDNLPPRKLYCRRCSVTGEGMNSGWLFEGDHDTVKYEKDVVHILRQCAHDYDIDPMGRSDDDLLQAAVELDICYYTDWEDDPMHRDEECYTLHGVRLTETWQKVNYLNGFPCTDEEVAAVTLCAQGYCAWVHDGDEDGRWSGKQKVVVGEVWTKGKSDSMAVGVHPDDVKEIGQWFHDGKLGACEARYHELEVQPDVWRGIGWQDIYRELGARNNSNKKETQA